MRTQARMRTGGFTLLEMIVATALMSIAVVGLLSLVSGSVSNAARIKHYDRAAMLARTKMNDLLVTYPLPLNQTTQGHWDASTGWQARVESFLGPPGAHPGMLQLVRIDLEVWWEADNRRRTVRLEGYRRDLIPLEGPR